MGGDVAALDRFMRKVRTLEAGVELDELESSWIAILRNVYRKYQARIGRQDSYALSGGTLCICFAEGKMDLMAECDRAHREALFPRRRKAKHISIEDDGIAEPEAQVAEDEAVIGVLNGMDSDDARLLRERYMGERKRTTKELAAEYGISDEAMRQRQTRARAKFKQRYEKEVADDERRVFPLIVGMLPRTERIFLRLWSDHGMTPEEIAEVYETTETHVEEIIDRAIERCEEWTGR